MAFGLSDLVNNIQGSLESLGQSLGLLSAKPGTQLNPDFPGLLSAFSESNWNQTMSYSFAVTNSLNANASGWGEFVLPLNPSDLNQDENFSVSFKATQGGTVVQHGGNRYKDLVIKGTTGKAPFSGAGGVDRSTGKAIFQPNTMKYKSGYEVFHLLRNWFRAYYQWKNDYTTDDVKNAKLIFRNFKDGEFLVVELIKFGLSRNSTRKYLYDYTLTFKVLGHLQFSPPQNTPDFLANVDTFVQNAKDKIDEARGVFLRSQDILRQVEGTYDNTVLEPLRKTSLAIKAFLGVGTTAADMGKQIVSNTVTEVASVGILLGVSKLSNLNTSDSTLVGKALTRAQNQSRVGASSNATNRQVAGLFDQSDILMKVSASMMPASSRAALALDQASAAALPRSFYFDTIASLKRVRDNAIDKFNLGSSTYNSQYERVSTAVVDTTKSATDAEIELLDGFNTAIKGLENLLASSGFFSNTYSAKIQNVQDQFTEALPIKAEQAVRQVVLPADVDLERLALNELGDSTRWIEIAELNSLKPPYIVQNLSDTTPGVAHPGDKIMVPAPIVNGFGTTPKGQPSYFTEQLSEVEKNLGVDFQVDDGFDLILSNRGDLEVVTGAKNAAQAIILKLMYEAGDLMKHPTIGVGLEPGSKFPQLTDIKMSVIRSLTQDPRFASVDSLRIRRDGPALYLDFTVNIKGVDIPVPVTVKL